MAVVCVWAFSANDLAFAGDQIVLRYADPSKAGTARTQAAEDTMKEIEKRTGGEVKHEIFWSGSLIKAKDAEKGVRAGTVDISESASIPYHPGLFKVWQFMQLPFIVGNDPYAVTLALNEMHDTNATLKDEFEKLGVKLVTFSSLTPSLIVSRKKIESAGDLDNIKIRALGPVGKWVKTIGGNPVSLPFYEISEALSRGIIDATQTYLYACDAYGFFESCKFQLMTPVGHIAVNYIMNPKTLAKMPPDIRKIYMDTWREFYPKRLVALAQKEDQKVIASGKKQGVDFYEITDAELSKWKAVAAPIYETYYQDMDKIDMDGKAIVDKYRSVYEKYAAGK
jgi:TRAP-type C4-dicarboxylate transport system substrate-binding protein